MTTWKEVTTANPAHSENYARRWKIMESQGQDIHGEARLIDAMVERGSRILDAGCGTGRLGGYLAARGHTVVGTDLDPVLIEHAVTDHPTATWYVGDLSEEPIPEAEFDLAVSAGNVMGFLADDGRTPALQHIFDALKRGGRFVVGFGAGRGWGFDDFLTTARDVGFRIDHTFSSWDLKPFNEDSTFLVAVLTRS
ncbi:SAM-dependent methyltransferase [Corynebacterium yudongzhengii]|uniref:Class I SAM-dependent methyltransferase n=1 Tax=Corynebacterium yudongzhengii TaxID=2080740 RepID=A0A2U1T8P2_9CORY|nr:class I SAM-dependent methyltransferase [Corynebacterium yudongzhengii]AWB81923.1 SAM-dependent methyltransferase [Corynebacterium yudongzhengii]PWC02315.1 class I SAM-dependent methyltransferase [Corynebacterium yudongzhengii]